MWSNTNRSLSQSGPAGGAKATPPEAPGDREARKTDKGTSCCSSLPTFPWLNLSPLLFKLQHKAHLHQKGPQTPLISWTQAGQASPRALKCPGSPAVDSARRLCSQSAQA